MMTQKPDQLRQKHGSDDNPFAAVGFFSFRLVSKVFYLTFPFSLGLCLLVMGRHRTKQLNRALAHDFLQTIFVLLVFVVVIIWAVWHFLFPLFCMSSRKWPLAGREHWYKAVTTYVLMRYSATAGADGI
jgi:hypothetical protein